VIAAARDIAGADLSKALRIAGKLERQSAVGAIKETLKAAIEADVVNARAALA
jgi:polyribonucleotide nucleotidyltransferase